MSDVLDGIEVVSWDVDGTLYDMRKVMLWVVVGAIGGLLRPGALTAWRELERLRHFRTAMAAVRERGGTLEPGEVPPDRDLVLRHEERWYGPAIARAGLVDEVGRSIRALADRDVRQVVVSDYQAAYKLRILGLDGTFERAYAGEALGHLKPAPELFEAVVADLGVSPERILHIGDKVNRDEVAAAAVGCRTLIVGRDPMPLA